MAFGKRMLKKRTSSLVLAKLYIYIPEERLM